MTVLPQNHPLRETRVIDDQQVLRCSKCKDWKPLDQFSTNKFTRSGRQSHCKSCMVEDRAASKAKYADRTEAKRATNRVRKAIQRSFSQKTPMSRKPKKTRQKPVTARKKAIRRVSEKRKKETAEYAKIRARFLLTHPYCMVCFDKFSEQIHHQRGREGKWLTDDHEFLAVCAGCHDKIENNREWAVERGYLKLRLTTDQLKPTQKYYDRVTPEGHPDEMP